MTYGFRHVYRVALALIFVAGLARPASADWLLTPYLGIVFGGAANTVDLADLDEAFEQRFNFGASVAVMGGGVLGLEFDVNQTPNFFQFTEGGEDFEFLNADSSLTTLMANLIVGVPVGGSGGVGVRPYVAGGVGLMRSNINVQDVLDNLSTNDLAMNVGGGVHIFFTDTLGFRADVRYFRGLADDDDPDEGDDFIDENFTLGDFDFWRGTLGFTLRFGG